MSNDLWYCDDIDTWSDDPDEHTQQVADDKGFSVSLEWTKGKQLKLRDYLSASDVLEHLDNQDDLCGLDESIFPTSTIGKDKIAELDQFLKTWCDSIDYPWWEQDPKGEVITVDANPR